MKGLILSGGKGTRLRPMTYTSAKQLLPVANKPIIFYGIEALREAGIVDIGIIVGETKKEIVEAVGDGSRWGVSITYIEQDAPLGLAHAVKTARDYLKKDRFVMYLGDNLLLEGIKKWADLYSQDNAHSHILLVKVPNPSSFGVAEVKDGRVVKLVEKPKQPKSDLALVGVYFFDHHVFEAVDQLKPSARGELEITDAIQWLVDHDFKVVPHQITGWWKDTGKLEDILEANRMVLDNLTMRVEGKVSESSRVEFKVVIEQGAEIVGSVVRGPAIIGRGARVEGSYVGPFTAIGENAVIQNSEVEHSIILGGSRILDLEGRIEDSLVGKDSVITRAKKFPRVHRFMIGDSSQVEIV
ncbi:MAG: glucose-1-phosphate thymidylyltransferase [Nitrospirae bacterium]|nr:glucose-1-phosphate thymidylyltransferase [Nitrospirota bacterium]